MEIKKGFSRQSGLWFSISIKIRNLYFKPNPMKIHTISKEDILKIYKPVNDHTHKGTQGHALLIGGSYGKIGAVCLSTKAALKSGCGLVTAFIPECGYTILQTSVPEVMVLTDTEKKYISDIQYNFTPNAIGIGPGIGQEQTTQNALNNFLKSIKIPLVIDADALNILSRNQKWFALLPENSILTPHQKELERMIGKWDDEDERLEMTKKFAKKHKLIIVSKGSPTQIIDSENIYENSTGNAALATAGSGDVLTGMITGLLAQSYNPLDSAMLAVYLHGLTADIALSTTGHESFIASDIISNIGSAFLTLKGNRREIGFK